MICPWDFAKWNETMTFCEERVCGWIVQPFNSWTSWSVAIVGLIIFLQAKNSLKVFRSLGVALIYLGVGTFAYHATKTYPAGVIDSMGMLMVVTWALLYSLQLLFKFSNKVFVFVYIALNTVLTIYSFFEPFYAATYLFLFFLTTAIFVETIRIYKLKISRDQVLKIFKPLVFCIFLLCVAFFVFWVPDSSGLVCDPKNHFINGRGIWHLLDALAMYFAYSYMKQFATK
jgi:hypothetical protein